MMRLPLSRIITFLGVAFSVIFIMCYCSRPVSDSSDDVSNELANVINDGHGDYLLVPAGEFEMGDNFNEGEADELPVHRVYLSDYYIGKYEVTNAEYKKFMDDAGYESQSYWGAGGFGEFGSQPLYWDNSTDADPRDGKKGTGFYRGRHVHGGGIIGHENFPANGVSWYEAMAYCSWLSTKTGHPYRLPTEAEWEKAARGSYEHNRDNPDLGHQRRFPWGDDLDNSYGNFWNSGDPYDNGTAPVGFYDGSKRGEYQTRYNASPYGAYDMAGNVFEWCLDFYVRSEKDDPHSSIVYQERFRHGIADNPRGSSIGNEVCLRSSDWHHNVVSETEKYYHRPRCSFRNYDPPHWRGANFGFRCVREVDGPILKGQYLSQKPPGMTPEIFASNVISRNEYHQGCSGFMKGGTLFIFSPIIPGSDWKYKPTYFMQLHDGKWTKPKLVPFNNQSPYNFTVAPDGKTLYFTSLRSADNSTILSKTSNIWIVQFGEKEWLEPKMLGPEVNSENYGENYPSISKRGDIYYSSNKPPSLGSGDIFFSKFAEGKYLEKQNLGEMINTKYREDDPFITSDGSFLIFCSTRPGGYGSFDLYISYKRKNGTWAKARNMGPEINTTGEEARPSITPDGKYFFFTRGNVNPDWRDIFWVDARVIQAMKPVEFK